MVNGKIILVIGILIIIGSFVFGGEGGFGDIFNIGKSKLVCDVRISNALFFNADIESISCSKAGSCGLFSVNTLSLLPVDDVLVEMIVDGKITSKSGSVLDIPGKDETFSLSLCVGEESNSGIIKLRNKDRDLIDSKNFVF